MKSALTSSSTTSACLSLVSISAAQSSPPRICRSSQACTRPSRSSALRYLRNSSRRGSSACAYEMNTRTPPEAVGASSRAMAHQREHAAEGFDHRELLVAPFAFRDLGHLLVDVLRELADVDHAVDVAVGCALQP